MYKKEIEHINSLLKSDGIGKFEVNFQSDMQYNGEGYQAIVVDGVPKGMRGRVSSYISLTGLFVINKYLDNKYEEPSVIGLDKSVNYN